MSVPRVADVVVEPLRVLVADDDAAIRLLCRLVLEAEGIEVVEAEDGAEAVNLAQAVPPDLVLLDVMMPRLNGWQVAARLHHEPATRGVPIVFLTALPEADVTAHRLGDTVVGKPFDPLALAALVREVAARAPRRG